MTHPLWSGMRDRKFGRVITISSINGQKGQMGQSNYSASKAGDIGFTKALAQEGARAGITVNAICPGYIGTEMVRAVPEKVLETHRRADPRRPPRRAGRDRALRGVPGVRGSRLHHRLDDHRQWRAIYGVTAALVSRILETKTAPVGAVLHYREHDSAMSFSNSVLCAKPASAAPTIGASQNSHSCCSATPPTNSAGPVERAGLTDVLVTGMEIR